MPMVKDSIQKEVVDGWRVFVSNLERSLDLLEKDIDETAEMSKACTSEWCTATEHVLDEISNSLFSISEPSWTSKEDSAKLKKLKKRIHELYGQYATAASKKK
jgi:hypothetical protein